VHEPGWAADPPPLVERAEGAFFFDVEGRRLIDGNSGLQNVLIGHGRREMSDVAGRQVAQLDFFPLFNGSHVPAELLAAKLHELQPHLERFHFVNSGSEAVETALKLVREYWVLKGEPERTVIVGREGSYHGATLGALAATGIASRREPFAPLLAEAAKLSRPVAHAGESEAAATRRLVDELQVTLERVGADRVMAVVGEPLQLKGMGIPPAGYWPAIRTLCDGYGIPIVADEVITGFGRTGRWFGMNHWGVEADVVTMAKGLCSGYAPIGAVGVSSEIAATFDAGSDGVFHHLSTTAGHPLATALALKNLEIIETEDLVERSAEIGGVLQALLEEAFLGLTCVLDVRGVGMLRSVQFDPAHTPGDATADARLARLCIQHGAFLRADCDLLFAPPLSIDEGVLKELVAIGRSAVDAWLAAGPLETR
jgi:putrescine aminotransferase